MSSISGLGGSNAFAAMQQRMFKRADGDGSGSVDASELQSMLDDISQHTGASFDDSAAVLAKMDSNGDGSLNADELASGMKDLMPPPPSTVAMAQQRGGGPAGAGGPPPGPPPGGARNDGDDAGSTGSTSGSSAATDPLDTNGDGTVSAQERMLGELKQLAARAAQVIKQYGQGAAGDTSSQRAGSTLLAEA